MQEMKTKTNLRVEIRTWRCMAVLCEDCTTPIYRKDQYGRLKDGFLNYCMKCCVEIGPNDDPDYPTKLTREFCQKSMRGNL
jgi:hypothetical protein